ncbi:hypothetical protein QYE76_019022 [Lolium multiflorum]|uniref:F-box domain-containing protein n=1 Tax=Lolium multiflorum TaxID=4521 RepID=A0AAD8VE12_LOLMU|nr:hypothetical protein QYE76_019022 [Lolium multiflorum]
MAKRRSKKLRRPFDSLTDDLILEILSRLPVKPLNRFKCVSKTWENLISDHNNRSKLPQTLTGFLYSSINPERSPLFALHFTNVSDSEIGFPLTLPTFNFLPKYETISLLDCCNGLLLCRWHGDSAEYGFHYVVFNPATKKWCALPHSSQAGKMCTARLGFDAAVSSHFHVFEFALDDDRDGDSFVEVYSSKTGRWVHSPSRRPRRATRGKQSSRRRRSPGLLRPSAAAAGLAAVAAAPAAKGGWGDPAVDARTARRPGFVFSGACGGLTARGCGGRWDAVAGGAGVVVLAAARPAAAGGGSGQGPIWAQMGLAGRGVRGSGASGRLGMVALQHCLPARSLLASRGRRGSGPGHGGGGLLPLWRWFGVGRPVCGRLWWISGSRTVPSC